MAPDLALSLNWQFTIRGVDMATGGLKLRFCRANLLVAFLRCFSSELVETGFHSRTISRQKLAFQAIALHRFAVQDIILCRTTKTAAGAIESRRGGAKNEAGRLTRPPLLFRNSIDATTRIRGLTPPARQKNRAPMSAPNHGKAIRIRNYYSLRPDLAGSAAPLESVLGSAGLVASFFSALGAA